VSALRSILALIAAVAAGCAAPAARPTTQAVAPTARTRVTIAGPATAPSDSKARLSLDEIGPRLTLAAAGPSTAPANPPIEAVRLFAQARGARLDGRTYVAADLLRKAVALDPGSFELHRSLAQTYAAASDPRALSEWEKATELEPNRLDAQLQLGRQYIMHGDFDSALQHLRLATRTSEYKEGTPLAGEADFLLARVLQQQGYDRAALDVYEQLLSRLTHANYAMRRNPQLAMILMHPEAISLRIASLYEKHGEFAPALKLLEGAAARDPSDFELQARIVRDAAGSGDHRRAARSAADLVSRFHAHKESVALLREVAGSDGAATEALHRLRREHPNDRQIVYALADFQAAGGHLADADRTIDEGLRRWPDDLPLLRKRVSLLRAARRADEAAKLLIASLARRPDRELELIPLWETLTRPAQFVWLRVDDVRQLATGADTEAARLVLLAHTARTWHRDALERDALRRAVECRPAFAPAFRQTLASLWSDPLRSSQEKLAGSQQLVESAKQAGDAALAAELRAQSLLDQHKPADAALAFTDAVKAGDRTPELYLNFAAALDAAGNHQGAQTLLWKLISDRPFCSEAYVELQRICEKERDTEQARKALTTWLAADPDGIPARRAEARESFLARHFQAVERILLDLFEHHDSNPEVLSSLQQFYGQTERLNELAPKLEQRLATEPWNFTLASVLVETYADRQRSAEAVRVLDQMRNTFAKEPDVLYQISGLYSRAGRQASAEQVLADLLKLDPSYTGASNDLGYTWAEQGRNLGEAEALVRKAVSAEPDNPSFLDSMGWVLYKRGKFAEALPILTRAAGPDGNADPVVLDHLGDTLYRLGEHDQAASRWQQAARRLADARDEEREELKQLRAQLLKKQQQFTAGQPVSVAPVVEVQ
jgi:tetratricopeptide (TPR) repeat protein